VEKLALPNYRDAEFLLKFLTEKGKIIPRRITGNCSKHQRTLARAIKRCRHSALIAFQME
jgi:small subunit ribosomal protein S18